MKTTKISFLVLLTFIMLWPDLAGSQNGQSVIERLKANTWQFPGQETIEITFTDSTNIYEFHENVTPNIMVNYFYLSDSIDSLFQRHKIASAENGRYISFIWREALLNNEDYLIQVFEILELNENEMILESQCKRPIVGSRTVRFVPKRDL